MGERFIEAESISILAAPQKIEVVDVVANREVIATGLHGFATTWPRWWNAVALALPAKQQHAAG